MADSTKPEIGSVGWIDLTVENAPQIRDFYASVTGWQHSPVSMGDYDDFNMTAPGSGEPKAGICHAKGGNTGLPAKWLIYITVADADAGAKRCEELGGKVLQGPKDMGEMGRYCVIEDPAGAVAALFTFS
jgi:predicted enzyme related to lactoylglutathione lyase